MVEIDPTTLENHVNKTGGKKKRKITKSGILYWFLKILKHSRFKLRLTISKKNDQNRSNSFREIVYTKFRKKN